MRLCSASWHQVFWTCDFHYKLDLGADCVASITGFNYLHHDCSITRRGGPHSTTHICHTIPIQSSLEAVTITIYMSTNGAITYVMIDNNVVALHFKYDFWQRTATAGSDVVQSGRPIFDDFFQQLWPYIGNNTAKVVFQMVKRLWLIRIDQ
ncbi:hypothetical protein TNCV_4492021 [Trichonephila clavipes]|nr:hypothetical protein TNCV_4492021 [Trichonephila clavipes]